MNILSSQLFVLLLKQNQFCRKLDFQTSARLVRERPNSLLNIELIHLILELRFKLINISKIMKLINICDTTYSII